ncbi:class I SAM-dependent methyltransferase [Candidatus Fermentibacteria bacterium]|nr:class I SAM-dependent methyltransferase [Candidatus Fermentibacteria bacterium]
MIDWIGPAPATIVHVEAGMGGYCLSLARDGHRVLGLDRDPTMVARARRMAQGEGLAHCVFLVADAQKSIPASWEVDRILILECWDRFSRPRDLLRSARAVMNPGARVLIITPNRQFPPLWWIANRIAGRYGPVFRDRFSFPRRIADLARTTGFRLARSVPLHRGGTLAVTLVREDPDD